VSGNVNIPDALARTNISLYGQGGVAWLQRLPSILAECEERWALKVGPPFPNLSYNYAAPAIRSDGTLAVIKLCYPNREFRTEAEALRLYNGEGAARLHEVELEQGVLLLEQIVPGTLLSQVEDDGLATSIAASVMKQLWRPVPEDNPFPTVADWAKGLQRLRAQFDGGTGPLSNRLVEQAEALFHDLLPSMSEPVLLHGDLHHFNILAATRQPWLAIDPKGVVGEAEYEVGALLRNPTPEICTWVGLSRIEERRIKQLAEELGFDAKRLRDWGLAQAVLSAWWSIEDTGEGWEEAMRIAQALSEIQV